MSNVDEFVRSPKTSFSVIPAQAEAGVTTWGTFCESVNVK